MARKKKYVPLIERGGFRLTEEGARNFFNVVSGKIKTKGWTLPHDTPEIPYATEEQMWEATLKAHELFGTNQRIEELKKDPAIQKRIAQFKKDAENAEARKEKARKKEEIEAKKQEKANKRGGTDVDRHAAESVIGK